MADLHFAPVGDAALRVTLGATLDAATTARVHALSGAVEAAALPGVRALVPAYTTLLVHFDPAVTTPAQLTPAIAALPQSLAALSTREWHLPVVYDGADLAEVAARTGLTAAEVVALHAGAAYTVACLGFAPGFGYLTGLPPALHLPRRAQPRPAIAGGSVIIAAQQAAVMPVALPSGWHVLGHTHLALFDANRAVPSLLQPGDRVRFTVISPHEALP